MTPSEHLSLLTAVLVAGTLSSDHYGDQSGALTVGDFVDVDEQHLNQHVALARAIRDACKEEPTQAEIDAAGRRLDEQQELAERALVQSNIMSKPC